MEKKAHLGLAGESVKQRLEKYDRLRQSIQDIENHREVSKHLADLPTDQHKFFPSSSANVNPSVPTQSMLPQDFSKGDVNQPLDLDPASIVSNEHDHEICSPLSTTDDGNYSSGSSRVDEHYSMVSHLRLLPSHLISNFAKETDLSPKDIPSSDTMPIDRRFPSLPLNIELSTRVSDWRVPGRTLLHQGVIMDSKETVSVLLAHAADLGARDNEGRTPLHLAASLGNVKIGRLLLMHGAASTISIADRHGLTAMHLAVQNGHVPMVEALVEFGAGVNLRF